MHKKFDVCRTKVNVTYYTGESLDAITKRLERDRGKLQDDGSFYAEQVTITETRVVKYTSREPQKG